MAEKKLYQVEMEVTFDMVVAAESAEEAKKFAEKNFQQGLDDTCYPGAGAAFVDGPLTKCPPDWDGICPYNAGDDKRTIDEYFKDEA